MLDKHLDCLTVTRDLKQAEEKVRDTRPVVVNPAERKDMLGALVARSASMIRSEPVLLATATLERHLAFPIVTRDLPNAGRRSARESLAAAAMKKDLWGAALRPTAT